MISYHEYFDKYKNNTRSLLEAIKDSAIEYYNYLINGNFDTLDNCKYFLLSLDKIYQEGYVSPLRDEEYDTALEIYLDHGGSMIRGDMSSNDKAEHVYPDLKGTIKKIHFVSKAEKEEKSKVKSHKCFEEWFEKRIEELVQKGYFSKKQEGKYQAFGPYVELGFYTKFDGLSVVLEIGEDGKVHSAITRGDKELGTGQNKTHVFKNLDFRKEVKDLGCKYGVKCEALVGKEAFESYNKKFGSNKLIDERSAATAILNQDNPTTEELQYLTLMPLMLNYKGRDIPLPNSNFIKEHPVFDWLDEVFPAMNLVFYLSKWKTSINYVQITINQLMKIVRSDKFEYPCDGIVIRFTDPEAQRLLGRDEEECINNFEIAYKFEPAQAKTKLIGIEQEIGLMGKVSFTAKVEPVKLNNRKIKSIALGSYERFKSLNLALGDEVQVRYNIIPYLVTDSSCKKSGKKPIEPITHCPYCGEELVFDPELRCNNLNCKARIIGSIYNFCEKIGIDGIGEETITTLFNNGIVENIPDLFRLKDKEKEVTSLDRFGKKSFDNMVKSIGKIKTVSPDVLVGSIGIPNFAKKTAKKVFKKVKFKDFLEMTLCDKDIKSLSEIEGIQEKTAKIILSGLDDRRDTIKELSKYLKIEEPKAKDYVLTVCFSKIRNHEFERYLEKKDVLVMDSVNKNTDLLIVGEGNSSKMDKARKLGIPIISIGEAYRRFGYSE